jgi:hypothetical protein
MSLNEDPYTRKLARRADARAAAIQRSLVPNPRSSAAQTELIQSITEQDEDAIEHLKTDLRAEQDRVNRIDVFNRPTRRASCLKRMAEIGAVMAKLHDL